VRFQVEVSASG